MRLREFISVWHLSVWEDGHHPLLVVDRLGGRHGIGQPLVLEEIRLVGVVSDEVLQRVELAAPDVEVSADGRDAEVVDAGLAQVGQHVGPGLAVGFPDQVRAHLLGGAQPLFGLMASHSAMVPPGNNTAHSEYSDTIILPLDYVFFAACLRFKMYPHFSEYKPCRGLLN